MIAGYIVRPAVTALRTLTVIPMPGQDSLSFGRSLLYFPIVGALIGALCCGLLYLLQGLANCQPYLVATIIVLFLLLVTGALHLDGLADSVDGFGGGKSKEKILAIMKDSRQGTFGVAAIVFAIILKVLLISPIVENGEYLKLGAVFFASRGIQPIIVAFFPYARKEGGTAAPFSVDSKPFAIASFVLTLTLLAGILRIEGLFIFMTAIFVMLLWSFYCKKKIDGITGDCIGAGNEFVEISILSFYIFSRI